jgi:hypothetical protein
MGATPSSLDKTLLYLWFLYEQGFRKGIQAALRVGLEVRVRLGQCAEHEKSERSIHMTDDHGGNRALKFQS